ncbi:MFS transporter, partial [Vibrio vulnificus]
MLSVIDAVLSRSRTMMTLLVMILLAGIGTYMTIPKESSPDITIPIIYVSVGHQGISPTDAERLLVRPIEQELRSIEGVKEMTSTASEGHASVMLEFTVGVDLAKAMADVRDAVDLAKPKLPADSDEPTVNEVT